MIDTDTILLDAIELAREAGKIHLSYFRTDRLDIKIKQNNADIVTAADKASELAVISGIRAKYPQHSILSEESGLDERGKNDWEWVIDPLDGTTNFSAGLPYFNVSIGVRYCGETVVGVVYGAYLNELFHAVKGEGAFLNGNPIHVGSQTDMHKAVITTGFPIDKAENPDNNLDNVTRVLPVVRGLRRLGSSALDICYVGAGFLDGYWEPNLHEWDVCAGMLVASEAGAVVDRYRPDRNVSLFVSAPGIATEFRSLLLTKPL
jgi:myo-inositol-1(or 4)-monophosphatase